MQLGIFAKTFARPGIEDVFDAVAGHGLACVQFNFAAAGLAPLPDLIAPGLLARIRQAAEARGIAIAAVSGTFNMIHPDPAERRHGLRRLAVLCPAAAALGAPLITLCTGTRDPADMWREHPANPSAEAWRDLEETLGEALAIAEPHGLSLGIEPEGGNVVSSARHARRLLDQMRSPQLKIVIDAANVVATAPAAQARDILNEAFDLLGPDIALAHAKEYAPGRMGDLPVGAGLIDWDHYLARLRLLKFSGALIMHGFAETDVPASVSFLQNKIARLSKN